MPVPGSGAAQSLRPVCVPRSVSSTRDFLESARLALSPPTSAVPKRERPVGRGVSLHEGLARCDRPCAHPALPTPWKSAATECKDTAEVGGQRQNKKARILSEPGLCAQSLETRAYTLVSPG